MRPICSRKARSRSTWWSSSQSSSRRRTWRLTYASISARKDALTLEILADDPAIVIGKHGATLEALQLVSNIHAGRINEGDPVRIILDTEDYRYRREQSLLRMASRVANEVRRTGRPRLLAPLNPFERRLIHTALGELGGVTTESEGDGLYKQIRVSSSD